MRQILPLIVLALLSALPAQVQTPALGQATILLRDGINLRYIPLTGITIAPDKLSASVQAGAAAASPTIIFSGDGFEQSTHFPPTGGTTLTVKVNTALILRWVAPPKAEGPCDGSAVISADVNYAYLCVSVGGAFRWKRIPFDPAWK